MKLAEIRQRTCYSPSALPTQKQATRTWLNSINKQYPLALTLTFKQCYEVKTEKGIYYRQLDRDEIRRIVTHFQHKLNQQIFGSSAKRVGKGLNYLAVLEGERTNKNLHVHMAIGGLPEYVEYKNVDKLVCNAKLSVKELDKQHKVDIVDSGWLEYITKELGSKDTDNVLWDLA